jgi:hypothetical protein
MTIAINLHLTIEPDKLREQILSVAAARLSLTIINADKDNLDAVIDILDDLLEKCINAESKRGK